MPVRNNIQEPIRLGKKPLSAEQLKRLKRLKLEPTLNNADGYYYIARTAEHKDLEFRENTHERGVDYTILWKKLPVVQIGRSLSQDETFAGVYFTGPYFKNASLQKELPLDQSPAASVSVAAHAAAAVAAEVKAEIKAPDAAAVAATSEEEWDILDFDRTITIHHTGGAQDEKELTPDKIRDNIRPGVAEFIIARLEAGKRVGIGSFADQRHAGGNPHKIGGKALIERYLRVMLNDRPDLMARIPIVAFDPSQDGKPNNKNLHIATLLEGRKIPKEKVNLYDDEKTNCDASKDIATAVPVTTEPLFWIHQLKARVPERFRPESVAEIKAAAVEPSKSDEELPLRLAWRQEYPHAALFDLLQGLPTKPRIYKQSGFVGLVVPKTEGDTLLQFGKSVLGVTPETEAKDIATREGFDSRSLCKFLPMPPSIFAILLGKDKPEMPRWEPIYSSSYFDGAGKEELNLAPMTERAAKRYVATVKRNLLRLMAGDEKLFSSAQPPYDFIDESQELEDDFDYLDTEDLRELAHFNDCVQITQSSNEGYCRVTFDIPKLYQMLDKIAAKNPALAEHIRRAKAVIEQGLFIQENYLGQQIARYGEEPRSHIQHHGTKNGQDYFEANITLPKTAPPDNTIFAIDMSESMLLAPTGLVKAPNDPNAPRSRLELLLDAMQDQLEELSKRADQHVSITFFSDWASAPAGLRLVPVSGPENAKNREKILKAIRDAVVHGNTNTLAGVQAALSCAETGFNNKVILVTDGKTSHESTAAKNALGMPLKDSNSRSGEYTIDKTFFEQEIQEAFTQAEARTGQTQIVAHSIFLAPQNDQDLETSRLITNRGQHRGTTVSITKQDQLQTELSKLMTDQMAGHQYATVKFTSNAAGDEKSIALGPIPYNKPTKVRFTRPSTGAAEVKLALETHFTATQDPSSAPLHITPQELTVKGDRPLSARDQREYAKDWVKKKLWEDYQLTPADLSVTLHHERNARIKGELEAKADIEQVEYADVYLRQLARPPLQERIAVHGIDPRTQEARVGHGYATRYRRGGVDIPLPEEKRPAVPTAAPMPKALTFLPPAGVEFESTGLLGYLDAVLSIKPKSDEKAAAAVPSPELMTLHERVKSWVRDVSAGKPSTDAKETAALITSYTAALGAYHGKNTHAPHVQKRLNDFCEKYHKQASGKTVTFAADAAAAAPAAAAASAARENNSYVRGRRITDGGGSYQRIRYGAR